MIDSTWRWKSFAWHELVPRNGKGYIKYVNPLLLDRLEMLKADLSQQTGRTVRIVINDWYWGGKFQWRGFRTATGNILANGRPGSLHKHGSAVDSHSPDVDASLIFNTAKSYFGGVIYYKSKGFVHLDVRNGPIYHKEK